MTSTLKPCPFCSGTPIKVIGNDGRHVVKCSACGASATGTTTLSPEFAWNRRAGSGPGLAPEDVAMQMRRAVDEALARLAIQSRS